MLLHPLDDDAEQAERPTTERGRRIHFLAIWPQSWPGIASKSGPAIACGREGARAWSSYESEVTCPDCFLAIGEAYGAHKHRKAEVKQWLKEIGAHVIQVHDLGAALEARYVGERTAALAHDTPRRKRGQAERAAHLARVALGEA